MRHIIVGDGATGTTAAYYIRKADKSASITIVSDDPNPAYYRAALTNYLLGELQEAQLFAVPPDFYIENSIDRILARVSSVDSKNNRITLADDRQIEYDQLLIASGSRPNAPTFPGADLSGVMTMRTLQDVRTVVDGIRAGRVKHAVVVGGGPLGIEWVQGLMHYKVHVTYLLRGDVFFDRALDKTASDLVISRLRAEGVDVRTNEEIDKAIAGINGRLRAVRLKNSGQTIDCQLAGTAIGIRPNIEFLQDSGIEIAKDEKRGTLLGVTVDKNMRTNVPNVYAGGDVINRTLGLWEPARLQGRVAGRNMVGGEESYEAGEHYFATRLYDLDFASVGSITEKPGDKVLIDFPRGSGRIAYRKLVIRENRLVGALMLGQRKENVRKYGLFYKQLIERKLDIAAVADRLLDSSFDLPNWIESLNIGQQIKTVQGILSTSSLPSAAKVRKTEMVEVSNTFASKPLKAPKALLQANGRVYQIEGTMSIGRRPENQIVIDEPLVSSKHAVIELDGIAYFILDNNSTNGTFVNNVPITERKMLQDGDVLQIGDTNLNFVLHFEGQKTSSLPEEITLEQPPPEPAPLGYVEYNGKRSEIKQDTITLGRDPEATILIDHPTVSFMHAQISLHGNRHYLRDLGSRNGTFVNEELVVTPVILKNNDMVRIGGAALKFTTNANTELIPPVAPKQVKTEFIKKESESEDLARLITYSGATIGLNFVLKPPTVTLGRDPESNDIALHNQTVSRNHVRFDWSKGKWHITDLGSGNGTRINGKEIKPNAETALESKDEVQFGDVKLMYVPLSSSLQSTPKLPMTFIIEPEQEAEPKTPSVAVEPPKIEPSKPPVVDKTPSIQAKAEYLQDEIARIMEKRPASAEEKPPSSNQAADEVGGEATQFMSSSFPTRLTVLAGPALGRVILLVKLPLTVGRTTTDDVQGLDDPLVSRQHLRIVLNPDGNIGITDLGSVNGTILNGILLVPNQMSILNKGDELRMGSTVLKAE